MLQNEIDNNHNIAKWSELWMFHSTVPPWNIHNYYFRPLMI